MANSTQMLKGLLEGCILKIISKDETYGYEACRNLISYGFKDISESSIYPILIRLEKKKLLYSKVKKSTIGPMRKYYYLTHDGEIELENFISTWTTVKRNVENVLDG